jgi:hypothetical protein
VESSCEFGIEPSGSMKCSEVLRNKDVVSCVCRPHIYNFILYVYIVYIMIHHMTKKLDH